MDALSSLRRVLFHASAYHAWPAIEAGGLLPASSLSEGQPLDRLREHGIGPIRDQRPLIRAKIEQHLNGVTLPEWLELVNERVWLFAQQKSLTTMLQRYSEGQDVIVFHTSRLLAAAEGRAEVLTDEMCAPEPWEYCPCRGRDTFVPLASYHGDPADVYEVAIPGGLKDLTSLVSRVVRYHPDRTTEVLVS